VPQCFDAESREQLVIPYWRVVQNVRVQRRPLFNRDKCESFLRFFLLAISCKPADLCTDTGARVEDPVRDSYIVNLIELELLMLTDTIIDCACESGTRVGQTWT